MVKTLVISFFILFLSADCLAQKLPFDSIKSEDTLNVKVIKPHSPTKATLMSAAVPGLGQIYNKKYWKTPIIWAGIGTSLYFGISNQRSFKKFKTAYIQRTDNDPSTIDQYADQLTDNGILLNMDYHQKNRDLSFIIAGVLYLLNIVDATVDAHLFNFPKNDNLSFNLQPSFDVTADNQITQGFKLVIKL